MRRTRLLLASAACALFGAPPAATQLARDNDGQLPPPNQCIIDTKLTFTVRDNPVDFKAPTALDWLVEIPPDCPNVQVSLENAAVAPTGSQPITAYRSRTYRLAASEQRGPVFSYKVATVDVTVHYPNAVVIDGTVPAPDRADVLVQAIQSGNEWQIVALCNVDINLSGRTGIVVGSNRQLIGKPGCERTMARLGPRVFTTDNLEKEELFHINGRNVRFSGFRLEGPTNFIAQGDRKEKGIIIDAQPVVPEPGAPPPPTNPNTTLNVEISNMDIYHWSGVGVQVIDRQTVDERGTLTNENVGTVRIRDSYLHLNRHGAGEGYGVVTSSGAYALIERNGFDENRHAIAGQSRHPSNYDYSGYTARDNLILNTGGVHCRDETMKDAGWGALIGAAIGAVLVVAVVAVVTVVTGGLGAIALGALLSGALLGLGGGAILGWGVGAVVGSACWQTHQLDMHGDGDAGDPDSHTHLCGTAGETIIVQRNTILYAKGTAVKIRGNPADKAVLDGNVFKNGKKDASWAPVNYFWPGAIDQTDDCNGNITKPIEVRPNNVFGRDPMATMATCNFGSGGQDSFMTSGVNWWAKSAATGQWYFLNSMPDMLPNLHVGDLDGDGICDVAREINPRQQYYSKSGRTPWMLVGAVDVGPVTDQ